MNGQRPRHRSPAARTALALIAVVIASGCGDSKLDVTGRVTYDGQPVEMGEISFIPVDGQGAPDGAVIIDGRYETRVEPGRKIVRITGSRLIPPERRGPHDPAVLREDFIPARFNTESQLEVNIEQNSPSLDFDLAPSEP